MAKDKKTAPTIPTYRVVGIVPGKIHMAGRDWDLAKLNPGQFDELYNLGCPYLELTEVEP